MNEIENGKCFARIEHCPRCSTVMEQLDEPFLTVGEMCAELARYGGEETVTLACFSRCPSGCHQCFGCKQWLAPGEDCPVCPACENCGGPLCLVSDDDEETTEPQFACMRCEDDEVDGAEDEAAYAPH